MSASSTQGDPGTDPLHRSLYRSGWLFAALACIPILFTAVTWSLSNGVPYFTDNNETYSAFAHARNMDLFGVAHNAMLTDDGVGLHPEAHPFTYTHQGNLPRYFSYFFRKIGIHSLPAQVLLAALISIALTFWLGSKAFQATPWATLAPLFMLLLATDFLAVLQWLGNLFRTWHMPLFFSAFACISLRKEYWLGAVSFFLLFQMEFVFAAFTFVAVLATLAATRRQTGTIGMAAAIAFGTTASLLLFIGQLVQFLGWEGFLYDLSVTYRARNSTTVGWDEISAFYEMHKLVMWPSFSDTNHGFGRFVVITAQYGSLMYGKVLWLLAVLGPLSSAIIWMGRGLNPKLFEVSSILRRLAEANARASVILWPIVGAYLAVGVFLSGYTMSSYVQRWGPLLNFPVMAGLISFIVLVGELTAAVVAATPVGTWDVAARRASLTGLAALILVAWAANSTEQYRKHPLFRHGPAELLATKYKGESFVSNTTYPHMISHYTQHWSYYSPLIFSGSTKLDQTYNWNADRMRNRDYEDPAYYLCQRVPYRIDVNCTEVADQMIALGHTLADSGPDFTIIKLKWAAHGPEAGSGPS